QAAVALARARSVLASALLRSAFSFDSRMFDWVELGRVRREEKHAGTDGVDRFSYSFCVMRVQVFHNYYVASAEGGQQRPAAEIEEGDLGGSAFVDHHCARSIECHCADHRKIRSVIPRSLAVRAFVFLRAAV